jgi:hypothetical protein
MLSDLYSGAELSKAYAMLGSAAGAGKVLLSFSLIVLSCLIVLRPIDSLLG